MTPLISMLTTNELSIPALPSPASKKYIYLLLMLYIKYGETKNATIHRIIVHTTQTLTGI
jgi:hypothetical protein